MNTIKEQPLPMTAEYIEDNPNRPESVDEYTRRHARLFGMMKSAMRETLAEAGRTPAMQERGCAPGSGQAERPLDPQLVVANVPLVFGDALYRVRETDKGLPLITRPRVDLGILGGLDRILLHTITSLLCVGGLLIVARHTTGKEETR
ncbi:hypothetical protein [Bifidobacterium samirii]|uniref:Uncharacterized protein n=1 Tax=Bifidobacterium samirii TaxID=2306974 RepID=A0A430FJC9_9BIFI|nr:hypothetical protein [Bifidobacterium samirii]RSX52995.1 hypothetical protein D2E24_1666 [Bifidobacterium samirii]